jgi:hypothetical protein
MALGLVAAYFKLVRRAVRTQCDGWLMDAFLQTLAGVVVGAVATYAAQRSLDKQHQEHKAVEAVAKLYDAARNALASVEASRRGVLVSLDPSGFPDVTSQELEEAAKKLTEEGLLRYQTASWEARAALAALPAAV